MCQDKRCLINFGMRIVLLTIKNNIMKKLKTSHKIALGISAVAAVIYAIKRVKAFKNAAVTNVD
jgi:hypothetical protein